jgi:hypothetical protein
MAYFRWYLAAENN